MYMKQLFQKAGTYVKNLLHKAGTHVEGLLQKAGLAVVTLTPMAASAAVDVSDITDLAVDVGLVGAAVLGILVAIKGIKLIRRCL
jgi:hypothetical protein